MARKHYSTEGATDDRDNAGWRSVDFSGRKTAVL